MNLSCLSELHFNSLVKMYSSLILLQSADTISYINRIHVIASLLLVHIIICNVTLHNVLVTYF